MNEVITTIISQCKQLSENEIKSVTDAFSRVFERQIESLIHELTTFNQEELVIVRDTINGVILTKENVPDIKESYERLKGNDLSINTSFGRLED